MGIDGWVTTTAEAQSLKTALAQNGLELISVEDPYESLWKDRPALPMNAPFILPLTYCGTDSTTKIEKFVNKSGPTRQMACWFLRSMRLPGH